MTAHADAVAALMDPPRPTVTMQAERLTAALLHEALPLLQEHWREVAHFPDIPLDVDQVAYLLAAQAGTLRCYTVRAPSPVSIDTVDQQYQELVGYALYFVRPNLHYKGSLQAAQDVIYIHPDVRGGTGVRFIAWCDEQLKAEGVQVVYHHAKARPDLPFATILERRGYELVDLIFAKRLDR